MVFVRTGKVGEALEVLGLSGEMNMGCACFFLSYSFNLHLKT